MGWTAAGYLRASGNNDGPSELLNNLDQDRDLLHQSPAGQLSLSLSSLDAETKTHTSAALLEWLDSHFHSYLSTQTQTRRYFVNMCTPLGFSQQGNYRTRVGSVDETLTCKREYTGR